MELPTDIRLGAVPGRKGTRFSVWSSRAEAIELCLFDEDDTETRLPLDRGADGVFSARVAGIGPGARYGFRADGPYDPAAGLWFDPAKLLLDPYAVALDSPFAYDPQLGAPRAAAIDTAPLMPKAVVTALPRAVNLRPPLFRPGGLIYELSVRSFTMLHPDVPEEQRGTVAALAHPAVLAHLIRLGVNAVELMPITAWIDERHLPPLGMSNSWGYNPVALMALDPRLCPGGLPELRATVAALRRAGIGVILDLVFNHTGESDAQGPTLSMRGLDARAYFRHTPGGTLVNDTGCGNTLDCDHPATRRLVLDTLRHFVAVAGVDGFRFDLAPILGRSATGFSPDAPVLAAMRADPLLADRVLIAEPWDIGPGGYQLGNFPSEFLEWNDRYRDRIRRFWRGDWHALGDFVSALAGSSDSFAPPATRSVNFIAAHDGFTLADLVAYEHKHNAPNGEGNRDGHNENLSWNNGAEGATDDPAIRAARGRDLRALLATLFASRGTIMLSAGDEFGRTQAGNNNAYAQDNPITWLDWTGRDAGLASFCSELASLRRAHPEIADPAFLTGEPGPDGRPDVRWLAPSGAELGAGAWQGAGTAFAMLLGEGPIAVLFNRGWQDITFRLPPGADWEGASDGLSTVSARSVAFLVPKVPKRRRRTLEPAAKGA